MVSSPQLSQRNAVADGAGDVGGEERLEVGAVGMSGLVAEMVSGTRISSSLAGGVLPRRQGWQFLIFKQHPHYDGGASAFGSRDKCRQGNSRIAIRCKTTR